MWKGPEEFFTYTKNQRNGIFLLVGLALAFFAVYRFWDFQKPSEILNQEEFEKMVAEWEEKKTRKKQKKFEEALFYFDPNTASTSELRKLGLETYQIKRINNFLKKGGGFTKPDDLLKIYGIDSNWVVSVIPFIRISDKNDNRKESEKIVFHSFNPNKIPKSELLAMGFSESQAKGIISFRKKVHPFKNEEDLYKVYSLDTQFVNSFISYLEFPDSHGVNQIEEVIKLDINQLDSNQIKNIHGFPEFLLERIYKYRISLGGFYELEQIGEVYGLDSLSIKKLESQIFVDQGFIVKMNLNEASFKELVNHPYLTFEQVKSIVNFRQKIRLFESVDELNQLELINDSLFTKIANYLEVGKTK